MVATPKSFKNPTEESLVPPIEQVSVLDPLKFLLSLAKLESTLLVAVKILAKHDENYMPPELKEVIGEK